MIKYSYSDILDDICTVSQYYEQFPVPKIVVGKRYVINKGSWMETTIEIIYEDDVIYLGKTVADVDGEKTYKRHLFHKNGYLRGWRYEDNRPTYRLQNLDKS